MKSRYDYAYAVGRVRALEARWIPEAIFRNAVEADSLDEVLNILSEFVHAEAIKKISNSRDLEFFLIERVNRLNNTVSRLLDDEQLTGALFSLSEDLILAKDRVSKVQLEFLENLLMHIVKLNDLTTYLRLNLSDKITDFMRGDYGDIARQASQAKQKENSYLSLEKLKPAFILKFLGGAKYITFGPEPIISYYFAELNQIRLLRWVILGKINQVPKDKLLALI
ncbi:MAG: V-type ATPase subunit [Candidatus Omnitrophota bacterium]